MIIKNTFAVFKTKTIKSRNCSQYIYLIVIFFWLKFLSWTASSRRKRILARKILANSTVLKKFQAPSLLNHNINLSYPEKKIMGHLLNVATVAFSLSTLAPRSWQFKMLAVYLLYPIYIYIYIYIYRYYLVQLNRSWE